MFFDDFDDDFFDDDFDDFSSGFSNKTSNDSFEELNKSISNFRIQPVKLLLLYDQGSLKSMLYKYLDISDYQLFEADSIESASTVLNNHPDLGLIISNLTVAGVGVASILKQLKDVNPDIICIICTDMMDMRSFVGLINTSPIYKILTIPLDIDKDLIPAINEVIGTYNARKANRDEWNELQFNNSSIKEDIQKAKYLATIQQGCIRSTYSYLNDILIGNIDIICKDFSKDDKQSLFTFQKNVTDKFFLSTSPKEKPLEETANEIAAKYGPTGSNKSVVPRIYKEEIANPLLKSKAAFLMWLYIYRISRFENDYYVNVNITFTTPSMAYVEITYRLEDGVWDEINSDPLQKSYGKVVEELTKLISGEYRKDINDNMIIFSNVISLE